MRPFRLVCTAAFFFVVGFLLLLSLLRPASNGNEQRHQQGEVRSRWSFGAPASLFPPSAIISLTDDNTTFFLARPALYGPVLPGDGLTGQLWVGSGFGDDSLIRGGMITVGQGELGCSDIPGWSEERAQIPSPVAGGSRSDTKIGSTSRSKDEARAYTGYSGEIPAEDDDTDNFLHYPLRGGPLLKNTRQDVMDSNAGHADIQSLQETAEISGKVVLLSRGGCGFFEKTKWVQRRGGVALIVGDYTRGGHLIQMSAHEDTSNVTIPSIFTAYTSAHLLSSLVPSKPTSDGTELDRSKKQQKIVVDKPAVITIPAVPKSGKVESLPSDAKTEPKVSTTQSTEPSGGWWNSFKHKIGLNRRTNASKDNRRPPSSGRVSWVQSHNWDHDQSAETSQKSKKTSSSKVEAGAAKAETADDFVIGVHDWRDPDMMAKPKQTNQKDAAEQAKKTKSDNTKATSNRLPESGVYEAEKEDPKMQTTTREKNKPAPVDTKQQGGSWMSKLLSPSSSSDQSAEELRKAQDMYKSKIAPHFVQDLQFEDENKKNPVEREGLWITMTPTSVSASPFFDTLLVLVISPLVTLSVVYALLLLRSRIRRRRWRAPRSVVDRLPVRTYHTMSYTPSTLSAHSTSSHNSSAATPLLPAAITRSRPRSATVSNIRQEATASLERATANLSSREKSSPGKNNAFKRKYKGRQIECVVCLEEYVDGQSQVMSLPCGHEFHVECITPWLTTRRRTCPICKGDVVRSMDGTSTPSSGASPSPSSSSSSYTSLVMLGESEAANPPSVASQPSHSTTVSPRIHATASSGTTTAATTATTRVETSTRPSPISHASDASFQESIAQTRNDSPSSAIPIPTASSSSAAGRGIPADGEDLAATLVGSRQSNDGILTPSSQQRSLQTGRE